MCRSLSVKHLGKSHLLLLIKKEKEKKKTLVISQVHWHHFQVSDNIFSRCWLQWPFSTCKSAYEQESKRLKLVSYVGGRKQRAKYNVFWSFRDVAVSYQMVADLWRVLFYGMGTGPQREPAGPGFLWPAGPSAGWQLWKQLAKCLVVSRSHSWALGRVRKSNRISFSSRRPKETCLWRKIQL